MYSCRLCRGRTLVIRPKWNSVFWLAFPACSYTSILRLYRCEQPQRVGIIFSCYGPKLDIEVTSTYMYPAIWSYTLEKACYMDMQLSPANALRTRNTYVSYLSCVGYAAKWLCSCQYLPSPMEYVSREKCGCAAMWLHSSQYLHCTLPLEVC